MKTSSRNATVAAAILLSVIAGSVGYGIGASGSGSAAAQSQPHRHAASRPTVGHDDAATRDYAAVMDVMHRDMAVAPSGDADVDFARGMIPHHVGAVAMAQVELRHGRDPEMRRLARRIVASQEPEIMEMRRWLAGKGDHVSASHEHGSMR